MHICLCFSQLQPSKLQPFWFPSRLKFAAGNLICKKVSLNQKSWLPNGGRAKTLTWRVEFSSKVSGCESIASQHKHSVCIGHHQRIKDHFKTGGTTHVLLFIVNMVVTFIHCESKHQSQKVVEITKRSKYKSRCRSLQLAPSHAPCGLYLKMI